MTFTKLILLVCAISLLSAFGSGPKGIEPLGTKVISDFKLRNVDNQFLKLSDYSDAKGFVVVFTCNHCPFAKLYPQRLNAMNEKYKALGVPLIAINSMDTLVYEDESFVLMQEKAKTEHLNFPYLYDPKQSVGKNFGAEHTPQAFVIWKEQNHWLVKYSGAIDDNGEHPELAKSFVNEAVEELLQGKAVTTPKTQSFGCRIFYRNNKKN